jgi:hypothetical protein
MKANAAASNGSNTTVANPHQTGWQNTGRCRTSASAQITVEDQTPASWTSNACFWQARPVMSESGYWSE